MDPYQKNKNLSYKSYINRVRGLYDQPIAQTSSALILTLGTIAFFGLAAIRPTLATVSELVGELEEKREVEEKLTQKIANLAKAQDEYLQNQQILTVFDVAIPNDQALDTLLLQLEYLAVQAETSLSNIRVSGLTTHGQISAKPDENDSKPKQDVVTGPFPSYEVNMVVEGDYQNLKSLLDKLDNLDRLLSIESVTFSQEEDEDQNLSVGMNVRLRAYWSSPNDQKSSGEKP